MFTIVGSGFGLYGYLPAVIAAFNEPVLLPEVYRAKVEARPELSPCRGAIRWVSDAEGALSQATGVVIATPPRRQVEVASQCLRLPGVRTLVLEKPLAPNPREAASLLDHLRASGKRYRLGYTLLHADWALRLHLPRHAEEVSMTWTFMAHHFAHGLSNWKREHAQGGGPLRFFGVHLLALLVRLGYREARESTLEGGVVGEPERWRALFTGAGLPDCRVLIDSRCAINAFRIAQGGAALVDLDDPYAGEPSAGDADRRIGVLQRFLGSLQLPDGEHHAFYEQVNLLWQKTEDATHHARS